MDPKQLLLEHFEKIFLGAAAGWLAFVGIGFLTTPPELAMDEQMNTGLQKIATHMVNAPAPTAKAPAWAGKLKAQLDPDEVDSAREFPHWVMHKRPGFLYFVKSGPEAHEPTHRPCVDVQASADRGVVTVTWEDSVENEYVIIHEYELQRRAGEDGSWEKVGIIASPDRRFEDKGVRSRTSYYYRVLSTAEIDRDNPVVQAEEMMLHESEARKESEPSQPVETARDTFIIPMAVTQITDEDRVKNPKLFNAKESADLKVFKWDAGSSSWLSHRFNNVKVGKKIGKKVKKRRKVIDFRTGAILEDVEIKKRKHPKFGHEQRVQVIKYKFADGSTEESNDKDKPAELNDK